MPRTKRRTVKRPSTDVSDNITMINQPKNVKELIEEFDIEKANIKNYFAELLDTRKNIIENAFLLAMMNLSDSMDTNIYDYLNEDIADKPPSKKPKRSARTLTTASRSKTKPLSASASRSRSDKTVTKHHSATRAVDDRAPLLEKNNEMKLKTPVNRPPTSLSTVTPKVNMNEPMSMMRRPNQGEVALSMTGSPLMVSSVSRDDMATVCVPLANGNVLSILPRAGATMDISFDEQTKQELLLLKGNIEGLLKMGKRS